MATQEKPNPTHTPPPLVAVAGGVVPAAKRQPVILKDPAVARPATRCAEAAANCAASCAAVCCCCPCGLVNLFVLATVRLPAGLCRRALYRRSRRRKAMAAKKWMEAGLLERKNATPIVVGGTQTEAASGQPVVVGNDGWVALSPERKMEEMEKEMWANSYTTGFWRSPSAREEER